MRLEMLVHTFIDCSTAKLDGLIGTLYLAFFIALYLKKIIFICFSNLCRIVSTL